MHSSAIRKKYLQPSILKVYKKHQSQLLSEIKKIRVGLIIGGDGRCDSPGHSAKYGSYTMMDLEKQAVVDIQLVQIRVHIYMYQSYVHAYVYRVMRCQAVTTWKRRD